MIGLLKKTKEISVRFNSWIETPVDPRAISAFRLWFGFLFLVNFSLLWPDMEMWFSNSGVLPPGVHKSITDGFRLNIYLITGYNDIAIILMKILGLAGGLGLFFGVFPRFSAACAWAVASSYSWRNAAVLHSGDNLIRIGCFFLMFAKSGQRYSLISFWKGKAYSKTSAEAVGRIPAWPQRILQIQLCIVYLAAGLWKFKGEPWRDGTAVGTVLQLGDFERFPIPDFIATPAVSALLTYFTLCFELAFPFLVWFAPFRRGVLVTGILLHAGLEWMMNVQMFQWVIASYYILFFEFNSNSKNKESF